MSGMYRDTYHIHFHSFNMWIFLVNMENMRFRTSVMLDLLNYFLFLISCQLEKVQIFASCS